MKLLKCLSLLFFVGFCGCRATLSFLTPEVKPYDSEIFDDYNRIELKVNSAADVLGKIHPKDKETISQSKSVIASVGQKKTGYKVWMTMISFDEDDLTAKRKYVFIEDEKPKSLFVEPWGSFKFNCQMVLDAEFLSEPYGNENARRIAILQKLQEEAREDTRSLASDNKQIALSGMLINQALESVLIKLKSSPALAAKMSEPKGLIFDHVSYDKGKIKLKITDDIVGIKIRMGSIAKKRLGAPDHSFRD